MGLASGRVALSEYDSNWPSAFAAEAIPLRDALGPLALAIEHVGSTAVPGLCAKPIIDIAVGVRDLTMGAVAAPALTSIGFEAKGEAGIPGRHFFAKGPKHDRTCYLHVEPLNGPLWRNHLLFREYLRDHPEEAEVYGRLKRALATRFRANRDEYARGKDRYVQAVIEAAGELYTLAPDGSVQPVPGQKQRRPRRALA